MRIPLSRFPVLVALIVAPLGCGGGGGGGGSGVKPGPTTVFFDGFGSGFPAGRWIARGATPPVIDASTGSPSPALMFASESGGGSEATMRTDVFSTMKGLTFTFKLAVDVTTLQAGSADRVSFQVVDVNGLSSPGQMSVTAAAGGLYRVSYRILLGSRQVVVQNEDFSLDSGFHEFRFEIRADGSAAWFRDGVQRSGTSESVAVTDVRVRLATTDCDAHFDEVKVVTP